MDSLPQILSGLFGLAVVIAIVGSFWIVFQKAGKPGWAAIVPIYNVIVLLEIAGKPIWWLILFFIPLLNFIAVILVSISIARSFGKGDGFGIGLALLGFVFYPMLAFSDSRYQGPAG